MAFGELYSALETRTVDGQENPYTVILSNKFYEVQKYVSATNHTFTPEHHPGQQDLLGQALADRAALMRDAYAESRGYQKDQTRLQTEKALDELQAKGMQYNAVAPAELERMRKTSQPVADKILRRLRPGDGEALQRRARPHPQGREADGSQPERRSRPSRLCSPGYRHIARRQLPGRRRMARVLDLYCSLLKGVIAAVPGGHGGAGLRQRRAALRLQFRHHRSRRSCRAGSWSGSPFSAPSSRCASMRIWASTAWSGCWPAGRQAHLLRHQLRA